MKPLVSHILVLAVAIAQPLTSEEQRKLKDLTPCQTESGVSQEVVDRALKGEVLDDDKLKKFALCVAKFLGVADEGGDIAPDALEKLLAKYTETRDKAKEVVKECVEKEGGAEQKVFQTFRCVKQNVPDFIPVK